MTPAQPPFPTAWYLPFQFDNGSHTSTLISESLDGFSVAATRQNAGSCLKATFCCAAPRPAAGSENCPAATVSANVIVVFSSETDFRLSHVAAATGVGANEIIVTASTTKTKLKIRKFIAHSFGGLFRGRTPNSEVREVGVRPRNRPKS